MKNLLKDYPNGMDLAEFIRKFGGEIKLNTRALYIIQPNAEKALKFGIAGSGNGDALKRLKEHRATYGDKDKSNPCKGAQIWYLGVTTYNRLVTKEKSQVAKVEADIKKDFKQFLKPDRGTELLFGVEPSKLIEFVSKSRHKDAQPTQVTSTRAVRPTTAQYRQSTTAYKDTPVTVRRSSRLAK
jgi:hypothetical protein